MSSLNPGQPPAGSAFSPSRRSRLPLMLALSASLLLGGCFRPLYGPTASGVTVQDQLAAVDITVVPKQGQERLVHYVQNELAFDLDGSGKTQTKRYRLEMTLTETLATSSVNQATGQAVNAILTINADYKLFPYGSTDTSKPLMQGRAQASASYDRTPQRYASLRAARDAQIRASRLLAEQLKTKLAAHFVSRPQ